MIKMTEKNLQGISNSLKCICSVYVPVTNPIKSADWWQQNFGLEFAVRFNPDENQAILKLADGQWLHLVETERPFNNQFKDVSGYEKFRLTFEVREIEVVYDHLQTNGVKIEELQDRGSCGINFVFYDLDGNKFDVNENVSVHRTTDEVNRVKDRLFSFVESE
jgi:catechol 2,3-dioxygenase-like lactoylglutathione lyase family enzyme